MKVKLLSHVQLLVTPWTAAYQAPPSMEFFQARVLEWGAIAFSWIGIFQVKKQLQNKLPFKQIKQNAIKFFHLLLILITYLMNIRTFSI